MFGHCSTTLNFDINESLAPNCSIPISINVTSTYVNNNYGGIHSWHYLYSITCYLGNFAKTGTMSWRSDYPSMTLNLMLYGINSWSGRTNVGSIHLDLKQNSYHHSVITGVLSPYRYF